MRLKSYDDREYERWLDHLRAAHDWACELDDPLPSEARPWVKLSSYDIQMMAIVLARTPITPVMSSSRKEAE